MRNIMKFSIALAVACAFSAASSRAQKALNDGGLVSVPKGGAAGVASQPPLRQTESVANVGTFRTFGDVNGAFPANDATPLYVTRPCVMGTPRSPILKPDGDQITFGEWNDVEGQVLVKCI